MLVPIVVAKLIRKNIVANTGGVEIHHDRQTKTHHEHREIPRTTDRDTPRTTNDRETPRTTDRDTPRQPPTTETHHEPTSTLLSTIGSGRMYAVAT